MKLNNAFKIGVVCFAFALALHDGAWAQIPEYDITVGRTIDVPGPSGLVYRDDGFWVISWSIGDGTRLHHYSSIGVLLGNYSVPEEYLVQGLAWDGAYWWIADNIHPSGDKIKKCELTSTGLNVLQEYIWPGPGSGPVALEWAQGYLWVVDNHTDVIYRTTINDTSFTSVEAWSSGNISPYGLAWDGTNMWSSCSPAGGGTSGPREIYKHDADGNIIEIWHYPGADGPPPGAYGGCATDIAFVGNRLWYCDYDKNQIIEAIRGAGIGLVAYYPFNGNANDESGNGNHGSLIGGATWTTGVLDGAVHLDGTGYINVPDSPSLDLSGGRGTIAAFIRVDPASNMSNEFGVSKESSSSYASTIAYEFLVRENASGKMVEYCIISDGTSCDYINNDDGESLKDSLWHHIALTWSGPGGKFVAYRDGVVVAEGDQTISTVNNIPEPVLIGAFRWNVPPGILRRMIGDIDEVRIYNRALSADEISELAGIREPAENWQIVYQTDFSSDPGWITSWPDRYVWDPATGTYCFSHIMYTYSYIPIAYDPTLKYKLEFDINLTQCEWGSYFNLGLWDADMLTKGPTHWHVRYHHVDEGNSACIVYWTNDLYGGGDSPIMPFALNTWYHNKAIYDPTSDMFTLEITRKDDGVLLGTYTLATVGEFLNIERLGISCTQSTYGDRLQAGCIDNVVLYVVPEPKPPPVYYVDAVNGNDNNDGLTRRTAFATIHKGIDSSRNSFKVLVYPGVYQEEVDFKGKAIAVQGVATKAGIPIIENPGDFVVSFYNGEGPRSILKNFVVRNSFMAVFIAGSSPTIKNLNVVDNKYGIEAYAGAEPDISNCIFWNNSDSDLFGCEARYSFVQQDIEPLPLRGLVAFWSFDENNRNIVPDKSGNGHNGTIYGATWAKGIAGTGLYFDGLNDYVDVPDDRGLSLTDAVTVSAWIWLDLDWLPEGHGGAGAIVCKHYDVAGKGYALRVLKDRRLRALLEGQHFDSQSKLNPGQWTHVAFTFDNSDGMVSLYINGNKEGRGVIAGSLTSSGCELRIGDQSCYPGGTGTEVFQGVIDEVRIFSRALSSEEIRLLYLSQLRSDPRFADAANSDYHLLSERGRYWPRADVLVLDEVTSPCVDGGDPYDDTADEPMPNGGRIDMGSFGGTPYASMSEIKWLDGDVNHDGVVNLIDLTMLVENWLKAE